MSIEEITNKYSRIRRIRKTCGLVAKAGLASLVLLGLKKVSGIENPDLDQVLAKGGLIIGYGGLLAYALSSFIQRDAEIQLRNIKNYLHRNL